MSILEPFKKKLRGNALYRFHFFAKKSNAKKRHLEIHLHKTIVSPGGGKKYLFSPTGLTSKRAISYMLRNYS